MSRKFAVSAIFLAAFFLAAPVRAAVWQVGTASGTPGDVVIVTVHFQGDGESAAADLSLVFSNTRLFANAPAGDLQSGGGAR